MGRVVYSGRRIRPGCPRKITDRHGPGPGDAVIGYGGDAAPLFEAAGLGSLIDDGFADLGRISAADFIARCAELRSWPRQASPKKAAAAQG